MKTLKNIVIGTSLTDHSDGIVRTGVAIAKATGATPWLIHAGAFLRDPSGAGADDNLRELLDEQARRTGLAALPDFSSDQVRLAAGPPHRMILELAHSVQADLVVIGAAESLHLLGSTANRVIRKAPCPVLAVRSEAAFPPIRVEFPVDLSPMSANALRQGLEFLAQLGLPVTESEVLFVLNPFEVGGSVNFTPEQIQRFAGEEVSRFVKASAPGTPGPQRTRMRTGYAREEILTVLKERRVDLAVLGTQGRSGFERLMLGSVAAGVLRSAECNLLIVPAAEAEEHSAGMDWISDEAPIATGRNSRIDMVLIGTSLGEESDHVVRTGLAMARAADARVFLAHAARTRPPLGGYEVEAAFQHEQITRSDEELRRQIERVGLREPELAGFKVQTGAPHRVLTGIAKEIGADLIVVGATGAGPFAAELLGSTAERVLRTARCPVLIVRGELPVPPRRVLAPVDLSTHSGDCFRCGLQMLSQLAGSAEIQVRAVHALSLFDALAFRQATGTSVEQAAQHAAAQLQRFVLENRQSGLPFPVEAAVIHGEPHFGILREVAEHPVDLLVLGTHGRGGLDRLMLGSVASAVARKAPCSVLVISPEAALGEGLAEAVRSQAEPTWHPEPAAGAAART